MSVQCRVLLLSIRCKIRSDRRKDVLLKPTHWSVVYAEIWLLNEKSRGKGCPCHRKLIPQKSNVINVVLLVESFLTLRDNQDEMWLTAEIFIIDGGACWKESFVSGTSWLFYRQVFSWKRFSLLHLKDKENFSLFNLWRRLFVENILCNEAVRWLQDSFSKFLVFKINISMRSKQTYLSSTNSTRMEILW